MEPDAGRAEEDHASYRLLVGLWSAENPVKTAKLLALLGVNALLVSVLVLAGGLVPGNLLPCVAGAGFSLIFVLSLGRTVLYQEAWRQKIRDLSHRYPGDERFQALETAMARQKAPAIARALGAVPSAYYLLGAPLLLLAAWIAALAIVLS